MNEGDIPMSGESIYYYASNNEEHPNKDYDE